MSKSKEESKVDKITEAYIKVRDERSELKKEYEEKDGELLKLLDGFEQQLLEICKEIGVESLKTPVGTATRVVKERVWASDWDAFKQFAMDHDALDLFEKRIAQRAFFDFLEENPDIVAPVNIDRKYGITVRRGKASNKSID